MPCAGALVAKVVEGVAVYREFYSEAMEAEHGVVAVELAHGELAHGELASSASSS